MLLCFLSTDPLCLPPPAPADSSTQDPLAGSWGLQDIHLEKSVLRRVQLGHGNEMSLHDVPATRPGHSPSVSPPGDHPTILPQTTPFGSSLDGRNLSWHLQAERHDGKFLSIHQRMYHRVERWCS